ncbi:MAG: hypothetical protein ACKVOQ_08995 [Cyclobacteriaceae bacterium]
MKYFLGVSPHCHARSFPTFGVALSATSPRSFLAVGFPLLSLTHSSTKFITANEGYHFK